MPSLMQVMTKTEGYMQIVFSISVQRKIKEKCSNFPTYSKFLIFYHIAHSQQNAYKYIMTLQNR